MPNLATKKPSITDRKLPVSVLQGNLDFKTDETIFLFLKEHIAFENHTVFINNFLNAFESEIEAARIFFTLHPDKKTLHAHYKGNQLIYELNEKAVSFLHSYLFIDEKLYVKPDRRFVIGVGSYHIVKCLINITDKKLDVMRIQRKPLPSTLKEKPDTLHQKNANPLKNEKIKHFELKSFSGLDLYYLTNIARLCSTEANATHQSHLLQLSYLLPLALNHFHLKTKKIHRDIKPENIVGYLNANNQFTIDLIDLDGAEKTDENGQIYSDKIEGTPQYVAPELAILIETCCLPSARLGTLSAALQDEIKNFGIDFPRNAITIPETNSRQFFYTRKTDGYALGKTLSNISHFLFSKLNKDFHNNVKQIASFMMYAHPDARLSPQIATIALFYLYWSHIADTNNQDETRTFESEAAKIQHQTNQLVSDAEPHIGTVSEDQAYLITYALLEVAKITELKLKHFESLKWLLTIISTSQWQLLDAIEKKFMGYILPDEEKREELQSNPSTLFFELTTTQPTPTIEEQKQEQEEMSLYQPKI